MDFTGLNLSYYQFRSREEINDQFLSVLTSLSNGFHTALQEVLQKYALLRSSGKKETLKYIYISYLRSSIIIQQPTYRIDLYDENRFADLTDCFSYWDVGSFMNQIYKDIYVLETKMLHSDDPREYHVEKIWLEEAEKYAITLSSQILSIIKACQGKVDLEGVEWYAGEFFDKSKRIITQ